MHPQPFNYSGPDSKLDMVRYIAAVNYIPFYVLTSVLRSRLSEYHATLFLSGARCVTSRRTAVFTGASGI